MIPGLGPEPLPSLPQARPAEARRPRHLEAALAEPEALLALGWSLNWGPKGPHEHKDRNMVYSIWYRVYGNYMVYGI